MSEGDYIQSCWEAVSGETEVNELTNQIFGIFDQAMEIKRQKNIELAA